jgi:hypothetical protein
VCVCSVVRGVWFAVCGVGCRVWCGVLCLIFGCSDTIIETSTHHDLWEKILSGIFLVGKKITFWWILT